MTDSNRNTILLIAVCVGDVCMKTGTSTKLMYTPIGSTRKATNANS